MAGSERVTGSQYRRALLTLAAVLVVGGISLTSPTVLSSHSGTPAGGPPPISVLTPTPGVSPTPSSTPTPTVAGTSDVEPTTAPPSVPTVTPVPTEPTATMTNLHKITSKRVSIPYSTVTSKDPNLAKGKTKVLRAGANGLKELTYTDGELTATKVIKKPVSKLVAIGTKLTKPWISDKKCELGRSPVMRVTVTDPDKVGYRLTVAWGKASQVFKGSGTKTFEFRPQWGFGWWWRHYPPCGEAQLG
jgi:hypothetical protein